MGECRSRIEIDRPAAEVFAFASDLQKLPAWLPMIHEAKPLGAGRMAAEVSVSGTPEHTEGWVRPDAETGRMEWGSDVEGRYRGALQVHDIAPGRSRLELTLHIGPGAVLAQRLPGGDAERVVQQRLEEALHRLRGLCEGAAPQGEPVQEIGLRSGGRQAKPDDDSLLRDSRTYGSSGTMNPRDTT